MRSDASRTRSFAREREASAAGCSPRVAAAAVNPSCAMTNSTTPGPAPLALTACVTCPRRINATLVVIPQPGHGSPSSAFMRHPDTCTSIAELTCATANTPAKISKGAMLTRSIMLRANRAALDHLSFTVSHGNGTPPQTRVAALCGEVRPRNGKPGGAPRKYGFSGANASTRFVRVHHWIRCAAHRFLCCHDEIVRDPATKLPVRSSGSSAALTSGRLGDELLPRVLYSELACESLDIDSAGFAMAKKALET